MAKFTDLPAELRCEIFSYLTAKRDKLALAKKNLLNSYRLPYRTQESCLLW